MGVMDDAKKMADDAATRRRRPRPTPRRSRDRRSTRPKRRPATGGGKAKVKAGELGEKAKPTTDKAKAEAAKIIRKPRRRPWT